MPLNIFSRDFVRFLCLDTFEFKKYLETGKQQNPLKQFHYFKEFFRFSCFYTLSLFKSV